MLNYWRNNPCGDTHLTGLRSRHLYSSEVGFSPPKISGEIAEIITWLELMRLVFGRAA